MAEKNDSKKVLGLTGFPLSHSFSEKYFEEKFRDEGIIDYTYRNFPLAEISSLVPLINSEPNSVAAYLSEEHGPSASWKQARIYLIQGRPCLPRYHSMAASGRDCSHTSELLWGWNLKKLSPLFGTMRL